MNNIDVGDVDAVIDKTRRRKQHISDAKERRQQINEARAAAGQPPLESEDYDPNSDDNESKPFKEDSPERASRQSKSLADVKRRKKVKLSGVDPNEIDTLQPPEREELSRIFKSVYGAIEQSEEEEDGYLS